MSGLRDCPARFETYCARLLPGLLLLLAAVAPLGEARANGKAVTLDRQTVVQKALASHPLVAIALDRERARSEQVGVARSDNYPHLTASFDQLFLNTALLGTIFPNGEPIAPEVFNPILTQEITAFGRRRHKIGEARHRLESARQERKEAELAVIYRANLAYDQLAMFEHLVAAARKSREDASLHLRLAEERFGNGIGVVTDLTAASLFFEQAKLEVVREKVALDKARADLVYAMGEEKLRPYRTDGRSPVRTPGRDPDRLIAYALAHRPLLLSAQALEQASEDRVARIRTRSFPHLSAFAQGIFIYGDPPIISGAPAGSGLFLPAYQTGVVLSVPLFVGGAIAHSTERARAIVRKESEKDRLLRIRVVRNIRKLCSDLAYRKQKVQLDAVRVADARKNFRRVEREFLRGLSDGVAARDAQTRLVRSRERLVVDRFRVRMIGDALDREIGDRRPETGS